MGPPVVVGNQAMLEEAHECLTRYINTFLLINELSFSFAVCAARKWHFLR